MYNIFIKKKINWGIIPVISLIICYVLLYVFFSVVLKYDFLHSDVLGYWQDSLVWQTPFHPFHVPGYPLMIALLSGLTVNSLSPIQTMMTINLIAFAFAVYLIYIIVSLFGIEERIAVMSAFIFGLWALVGLTYTVVPLADIPAICLFLLGLFYLQRLKFLSAGTFFGLSLITHKAIWIFVFLIVMFDFFRRREYLSRRNFILLTATILPIILLWLSGSFYHNSYTWMISSNMNVELASRSSLPILDGILGTLIKGGMKGVFKGMILIAFLTVSVISLMVNINQVTDYRLWGLAVSIGVLLLFAILNQNEIWAAVRFSRLLIIPLAISSSKMVGNLLFRKKLIVGISLLLSLFFLSQFAYAWYIARVYYAQ